MSSYLTSLPPSSVGDGGHVYKYDCVLQHSSIVISTPIGSGTVYSTSIDSRDGVDKKVAFSIENHDSGQTLSDLIRVCRSFPTALLRRIKIEGSISVGGCFRGTCLTPLSSNCSWHATQQHNNPTDDRHLMEHVQAIPQAIANGWDTMGSIELGSIATRFSHEEKQIRSDRSLLAWKSFLLVRFITSKSTHSNAPYTRPTFG